MFDDGQLNLWIPSGEGEFRHPVYRAVINKKTLQVSFLRKTPVRTSNNYFFQAAHDAPENFLVSEVFPGSSEPPIEGFSYFGFPFKESGTLDGKATPLLLTPTKIRHEVGVSSDGRILYFENRDATNKPEFWIQKLDKRHPQGNPFRVLDRAIPRGVSNIVSGNRRFVAFTKPFSQMDTVYLQVFMAGTFQPIGAPLRVGTNRVSDGHSVEMDPKGRFIIYVRDSVTYPLMFQQLNSSGQPIGPGKEIASGVFAGVAIALSK